MKKIFKPKPCELIINKTFATNIPNHVWICLEMQQHSAYHSTPIFPTFNNSRNNDVTDWVFNGKSNNLKSNFFSLELSLMVKDWRFVIRVIRWIKRTKNNLVLQFCGFWQNLVKRAKVDVEEWKNALLMKLGLN